MEKISAAATIGRTIDAGATMDAVKASQFIQERLHSMSDEHLDQLHEAVTLAAASLEGNADRQVILERAVRGSALFLTGGAIASGMYALLPFLFAVAFPDMVPGLKAPSTARSEKRAIATKVLEAIEGEREQRSRSRRR